MLFLETLYGLMGASYPHWCRFFDGSVDSLEQTLRLQTSESGFMDQHADSNACQKEAKTVVPRRKCSELSYEAFVLEYMIPNKPVIIQVKSYLLI